MSIALYLSKLLPPLLLPLGLCLILLAFTILFALRAGAYKAAFFGSFTWILLYLASCGPVSSALMRPLERRIPVDSSFKGAIAIVLLGGASIPAEPPREHVETNEFADRVLHTAWLWRRGVAPHIVTTGGKIPWLHDYPSTEADDYAIMLRDFCGLPDSAIAWRMSRSRNTYEDALFTSEDFEKRGLKKEIVLVTSAFHMPRSKALFEKQGFKVHASPTDYMVGDNKGAGALDFLPSDRNLSRTNWALHEWLGMLVYGVMGRM